ncbi:MAG: hypothetical protein IKS66_07000 [Oscillospiraceae bacterium]|nr:hypothetical protein [Oscillospiraceae bacterium]
MSDYIITTTSTSTSDLPRTWLDAHRVPFLPYSYTVNDKLFEDDCREERRDAPGGPAQDFHDQPVHL